MYKHLKPMSETNIPQLHLEDRQMPHSIVHKQTNILQYTSTGQYRYIAVGKTSEPLISNTAAVYFEAEMLNCSQLSELGVGLIHKDCDLSRHPGKNNKSIGYLSTGDFFVNKHKRKTLRKYKKGSIVGIGIIFASREIFTVVDGQIQWKIQLKADTFQANYCPCISMRNRGDKIKLHFKNFKFDFNTFLRQTQLKCQQQIQKQKCTLSQTENPSFAIIADYLKFYGYQKTLGEMLQKQTVKSLGCYIEHPFFKNKVELGKQSIKKDGDDSNSKIDQGLSSKKQKQDKNKSQKKSLRKQQKQFEIQQNQQIPQYRLRIQSQSFDRIPMQFSRKKTYDLERQLFQSRRKDSLISNEDIQFSNSKVISPNQKKDKTIKSKIIYNQQTTNFLNKERVQILNLLRNKQLQPALQIIHQKLPQLFQVHPYLEDYFKMHTYLYILKQHGPSSAIKYVKQENIHFKKYKKQLFPAFLANGKVQYKQFAYLMSLVTLKDLDGCVVLMDGQFQGFANFVNEIILKAFGLYSESRLDMLVNHIKTIAVKAQQYHVPGPFVFNDF